MTNQLRKFGYEAAVVYAGNTPADGTRQDVMPQNERQRKAAELNPAKQRDLMLGTIPVISQRMLAAAAGVGFFGMEHRKNRLRSRPMSEYGCYVNPAVRSGHILYRSPGTSITRSRFP
jgi:hypothetical protein